jgi:hypothetical protein
MARLEGPGLFMTTLMILGQGKVEYGKSTHEASVWAI